MTFAFPGCFEKDILKNREGEHSKDFLITHFQGRSNEKLFPLGKDLPRAAVVSIGEMSVKTAHMLLPLMAAAGIRVFIKSNHERDKENLLDLNSIFRFLSSSGPSGVLFDIRIGGASPLKSIQETTVLLLSLEEICEILKISSCSVLSSQHQPLGKAFGSPYAVLEILDFLNGRGPFDVNKLVLELGTNIMRLVGASSDRNAAKKHLKAKIMRGSALDSYKKYIIAHKGNARFFDDNSLLLAGKKKRRVRSMKKGYIIRISLERLFKNRALKISLSSLGLLFLKQTGDRIKIGDVLGEIAAPQPYDTSALLRAFNESIDFSDSPPLFSPFLLETSGILRRSSGLEEIKC